MDIFDIRNYHMFVGNVEFKTNDLYFANTNIAERIANYVDVDEVNISYPQKLLSENQEAKLIIVLKESILIITADKDSITVHNQKIINIDTKEITEKVNGLRNAVLKINFKNGYELILDSKEDSNTYLQHKYADKIKEIFKLL